MGTEVVPRQSRIPFALRILPLFALVYTAFVLWWWSMSAAFGEGLHLLGIAVGYSLPVVVTLVALVASRGSRPGRLRSLSPLLSLIPLAALYALVILSIGAGDQVRWVVTSLDGQGRVVAEVVTASVFSEVSPFLGIAFISAVVAIMLHPTAGSLPYFSYRTVLFVGGVIFMPLFVVISAILRSPAELGEKAWLLGAAMVGFWASAGWLASRRTQGGYVPGLEIRRGLPFRPDLVLPGGVSYVKGVILSGVGMMIMFQETFLLPRWNWWGFVLAFWGIVAIIPLRGMYKMLFGRRRRFLGDPKGQGFFQGFARGNLLFAGLLVLLYGFLSAFMGAVPFVAFFPKADLAPQAVAFLLSAYIVLVLLRESYKRGLREGAEAPSQLLAKLLLLYGGTLLLLYGSILLFMGRWTVPHPETNPWGLALGLSLFLSGLVLIVPIRYRALQNEFAATLRIMAGVISDLPDAEREAIMRQRLAALAAMDRPQRTRHVGLMLQGLEALPKEKRMGMRRTMMELLADLPSEQRQGVMRSMEEAQAGDAAALP